jgi:hypothetical protein
VIWLQDCHGDSYDVTAMGGLVYSVSHAHDCSNIGGWPNDEVDYQRKHYLLDQAVHGTPL